MRRKFSHLGVLITLGICAGAVAILPGPTEVREDPLASASMAERLLDREPGFRRRAREDFPADRWSREDHFANMELRTARGLARAAQVDVGQVLFAYDALLRAEGHFDAVAACRPRLSY